MKKIFLIIIGLLLWVKVCFAITLMSDRESIKHFFPREDIVTQKITATDQQLSAIKGLLGGQLVNSLNSEGAKELALVKEWDFYIIKNEQGLIGAAIILDEPGKWGPIRFAICLTPQGAIHDALVIKYSETRGRPVASHNFLKQFTGKNLLDPLRIDNDIQAIAGATISSQAACSVMKKAMVLFKVLLGQ